MKSLYFKCLLILLGLNVTFAEAQIRIACVGNSITFGAGIKERDKNSYPAQLQSLLGEKYKVLNFGVSGTTVLKKGNSPYQITPTYQQALKSNPDIVLIKLGTNDSKLINRKYLSELRSDYTALIKSFRDLASNPRIIILLPVPAFKTDTTSIWDTFLAKKIIPEIQQVAYKEKVEILNLHPLFMDHAELFPDQIHPNAAGAGMIAARIKEHLIDTEFTDFDVSPLLKDSVVKKFFYGFNDYQFKFNGHPAHIVQPKKTAKGNPWIWRARFWGHEPQTDIALLERGYHLVYCDVVELYGNKEAVSIWNDFYTYVRKLGFAKKVVLEGMSRGGVYVYNWAAENPKKVVCVYADNPVLDLKSWPGGRGVGPGSKGDWETFKKDYNISTEEQIVAFKNSPIDKAAAIVKGKYPMLHVCGDADETVPMEENTIPFEKKIKALGGDITVIHKSGAKHHPHSLVNPTPIVDFILKAAKK
jgi:lysophospholipase L1-like esterase